MQGQKLVVIQHCYKHNAVPGNPEIEDATAAFAHLFVAWLLLLTRLLYISYVGRKLDQPQTDVQQQQC